MVEVATHIVKAVCGLLNAQADGLLALESCMCLFGLDADKTSIMDKTRLVLLPLPLPPLVSAIWHAPVSSTQFERADLAPS